MAPESLVLLACGAVILMVAWLPLLTRNVPLSMPIIAVASGFAVAWWMGTQNLVDRYDRSAELLSEMVLLIAVMGAGLSIDRPFGWRSWGSAWRLLIGVLPLTILGLAACGVWIFGLPVGEALLLAAILSPTDPVLAGSVEVGPPGVGEEGETRFALTTEAGFNDGLAFPFVLLGIALMANPLAPAAWGEWVLVDLVWKIGAGLAIGFVFGRGLTRISQRLPERYRLSTSRRGIVSIGVTFMAYGLAEIAHANGFVAVFVAAIAIRNTVHQIDYTRQIHGFAAEIQQVAMVALLVFFGAAIASGLLSALRPADAGYILVALFVVRPLASLVSFVGSPHQLPVRIASGMLGVRGIASLFYIAYASNHASLSDEPHMRSLVAATVLASILVFGIAADPAMRHLDRRAAPPERDDAK